MSSPEDPPLDSGPIIRQPQVKDLIGKGRYRYRLNDDSVAGEELLKLSAEVLEGIHPADIAEGLEGLTNRHKANLISSLTSEHAAEVLSRMDEREQLKVASRLIQKGLTRILEAMPADEAADLLGQFDPSTIDEILVRMDEESRYETIELLAHGEDTAGGVMEKELVDFYEDTTVKEAMTMIRTRFESSDFLNYIYITNRKQELLGVMSLKELILAEGKYTLGELMHRELISVDINEDQEKVAYLATKYDLQAIPVVNQRHQLVGIVSPQDISDIIEDEHKEDIYRMAGVHEESGIHANPVRAAFLRFPWLIATVAGGLVAAKIIEHSKEPEHLWLLYFSPLILGLAGNVAIQTSTIIIRNLSVRQFAQPLSVRYLLKEANTGVVLAVLCGITLGAIVTVSQGNAHRGMTLGLSLFTVILLSITCSILIPMGFNRMNIDPAVASGPLVTTFIDVLGLLIYFQTAYLVLSMVVN